jgi:hypothetical protein
MASYSMTKPLVLSSIETFKSRVDALATRDFVADVKGALNVSYKKRGGLHFAKLGDLSVSWSIKTKPVQPPREPIGEPVTVDLNARISRFVK